MRDPARIDQILTEIRTLWTKEPDWRLCQLLSNVGAEVGKRGDLFYFEDDSLFLALMKYNRTHKVNKS